MGKNEWSYISHITGKERFPNVFCKKGIVKDFANVDKETRSLICAGVVFNKVGVQFSCELWKAPSGKSFSITLALYIQDWL